VLPTNWLCDIDLPSPGDAGDEMSTAADEFSDELARSWRDAALETAVAARTSWDADENDEDKLGRELAISWRAECESVMSPEAGPPPATSGAVDRDDDPLGASLSAAWTNAGNGTPLVCCCRS
jgi:hypothetical protein